MALFALIQALFSAIVGILFTLMLFFGQPVDGAQ